MRKTGIFVCKTAFCNCKTGFCNCKSPFFVCKTQNCSRKTQFCNRFSRNCRGKTQFFICKFQFCSGRDRVSGANDFQISSLSVFGNSATGAGRLASASSLHSSVSALGQSEFVLLTLLGGTTSTPTKHTTTITNHEKT